MTPQLEVVKQPEQPKRWDWRYFFLGISLALLIVLILSVTYMAFASGPTFASPSSPSAVNAAGKSLLTVQAPNIFADAGALEVRGHNCTYKLTSDVSGNLAVSTTTSNCGGGVEMFTVPYADFSNLVNIGTAFTQGGLEVTGPAAANINATGVVAGGTVFADGGALEVGGPTCTYTLTSDGSGHLVVGSNPVNCGGGGNYFIVSYLNVTPGGLFVDTLYSNGGEPFNSYYGIQIGNAGTGIHIANYGQATLSTGGTVTVSNAAVVSTSNIQLTGNGATNVGTLTIGTIVANTSFVINSTNASDTRVVNWVLLN